MSEQPRSDMERDAKLAALYRAASHDEPPPALDDAIRAAARRAVASKPRRAASPFSRSWRVPLSIAAVLVLSVSLVTLMREEAPEMTQPPGAELSLPRSAGDRRPAESVPAAEEQSPAIPRTLVPDSQQPSGLGLKPSSSSSADGIRRDAGSVASVTQLRKEAAAADRIEAQAPSTPSPPKQTSPEAFPGAAAVDSNRAAPARLAAKEEARRDIAAAEAPRPLASAAAPAENQAQSKAEADSNARESARARAQAVPVPPAPAAKPAASPPSPVAMEKRAPQPLGVVQSYASQPPEKWLEQIEDLRKQGRVEEARASLADFRKRYPDHQLPAALKEWVKP